MINEEFRIPMKIPESWNRATSRILLTFLSCIFREGRAGKYMLFFVICQSTLLILTALVTSYGVIKYMVAYSLTQFLTVIMLYTVIACNFLSVSFVI